MAPLTITAQTTSTGMVLEISLHHVHKTIIKEATIMPTRGMALVITRTMTAAIRTMMEMTVQAMTSIRRMTAAATATRIPTTTALRGHELMSHLLTEDTLHT